VAAGLNRSPLFVDPDLGSLLAPADRTAVEAALQGAGVPIYVVVIPLIGEDESGGLASQFHARLHDRFRRAGVYIVINESRYLDEEEWRVPRRIIFSAAVRDNQFQHDAPVAPRLLAMIDEIVRSPAGPPTDSYHSKLETVPARNRSDTAPAGEVVGTAALGALVVGPLFGLPLYIAVVAVIAGYRRGTGRSTGSRGAALPLRTPAAPSHPDGRWLRRLAEAELAALNAALGPDPAPGSLPPRPEPRRPRRWPPTTPPPPRRRQHRRRRTPRSRGCDRDRPRRPPRPPLPHRNRRSRTDETGEMLPVPCAVNPLHGPAVRRRFVALAGQPARQQPLCPGCADTTTTERNADVLHVPINGQPTPYLSARGCGRAASTPPGPVLIKRVEENFGVD